MAEFKEIEDKPPVQFNEKGDKVEGKLLAKRPGNYNKTNYDIQIEDGSTVTVFGSTILERRMSGVKEGQTVRIVFDDYQKLPGGKRLKLFKVFVK